MAFACKGRGVCPSCTGRRMAPGMLAWENSGFSVDASVRVALVDRDVPSYFKSLEHLLRYCARPAFALERLSLHPGRDGGSDRPRRQGPWMALPP